MQLFIILSCPSWRPPNPFFLKGIFCQCLCLERDRSVSAGHLCVTCFHFPCHCLSMIGTGGVGAVACQREPNNHAADDEGDGESERTLLTFYRALVSQEVKRYDRKWVFGFTLNFLRRYFRMDSKLLSRGLFRLHCLLSNADRFTP